MNILAFDCESFPNVGLTWGTWDQKVLKVLKRRMICSIAWTWYPKGKVETMALCDMPGYDPDSYMRNLLSGKPDYSDNKKLMRAFKNEVLNKADIAIAHNLAEFDDKMVNTDLFLNNLGAAADHRQIDTLKVLRSRMRLNSNRLDDVCQELGIGKKLKHPGLEMWIGCMAGDRECWKMMRRYNAHDVDPLLVGLYEHVRPFITNHPNVSVDSGSPGCPSCGHKSLSSDGWRYTQARAYRRMNCRACQSRCKMVTRKDGSFYYCP